MENAGSSEHLGVDLLWYRDAKGYALEDHGSYGSWIVRRGGDLVPVYPLRGGFAFKAFANVSIDNDLVEFMKCYGFLDRVDPYGPSFFREKSGKYCRVKGAPEPCGENVQRHLQSATFFREILQVRPRRHLSREVADWIEDLGVDGIGDVQMHFDERGILRPVLKPTSLMSGLFWQLFNSVRGGAQYRPCDHCGIIFRMGAGSDRRTGAKFCSDEHKVLFHSRRRSIR